ncbi:MAG: cobalt-precorrin-5B (C(1))-methyltransferase [Candidatus Competibacteraceae bacterium]|nr:cobalt-precorrin-5B (C(1))-methyltransferase [Candidatus Competibacteraceae bacterium]MBK8898627.1 cobalt-precorrin-5B (C(1))-methyltransferase [Candidatus Competibacteraceae bacterium]MBK9951644.1 cobalt-precorrin-5B (C(1))-methyltransferase [Candidatus Competibacteraceae bacterium]
MRPETAETAKPLHYGFTTGACATAASTAAASRLLTGIARDQIEILLPRGQRPLFRLEYCRLTETGAEAATIKDAGDDPDVTHGALVFARVALSSLPGARFHAGPGVGIVTRPGLPVPVGEPAINPTPRRMIVEHLARLSDQQGYTGGFEITLGIENGAELASKTLNPRLGIVGGLSVLGTTGIVRPFSCSAYIASIQQAIDVARANGIIHIAACTGATSEQTLRARYGLSDLALIEMGDFAGAVLKHLRRAPVPQLSLAGGFGKISKLAAGHLDLHSRSSSVDLPLLALEAAALGASEALQAAMRAANTSQRALALALAAGLPLGERVCAQARARARAVLPSEVAVEIWATDREGQPVGHAGFA